MISIKNLHKSFGTQVVLDGLNLEIKTGEIIAVVGPSGTGKSVLLKIITGLLEADSGEVMIGEDCITSAKSAFEKRRICSHMGVLFQGAALFDSMSLLDNVAFPLRYRKVCPEKEIIERSVKCLHDVGLKGFELVLPGEVSIGMRKRVGIARALVTEPELILFDEPNTGLDPEMGQEIYDLINETHAKRGFTGIVVSHELPEVFQVCSKVVMLFKGKVQQEGDVASFLNSTNPIVQQFIKGEVSGPIAMNY
ncbi:MAG: ATP-binding cassette domain-containing protein [Proteobacteria bacterium]|nr:ATP-binding cassette domain-containing protein [Pseudomonadota bacterium]